MKNNSHDTTLWAALFSIHLYDTRSCLEHRSFRLHTASDPISRPTCRRAWLSAVCHGCPSSSNPTTDLAATAMQDDTTRLGTCSWQGRCASKVHISRVVRKTRGRRVESSDEQIEHTTCQPTINFQIPSCSKMQTKACAPCSAHRFTSVHEGSSGAYPSFSPKRAQDTLPASAVPRLIVYH